MISPGKTFRQLAAEQFQGWRPSEVIWLAASVSAILALSLYWGESVWGLTAAITGMMYTVLAGKGKVACFLFGLINTPIYAGLAFRAGYYGDFTLNVYYFLMMIPGARAWLRHQATQPELGIVRTRLTGRERLKLALGCLGGILATWLILRFAGGSRPFCDAITNILSIAAMILTVRRALEEWILWILVNAVETVMWFAAWRAGAGDISILLMWLLFLVNGVYLLTLWLRAEKQASSQRG